jgi:hypothetical protein
MHHTIDHLNIGHPPIQIVEPKHGTTSFQSRIIYGQRDSAKENYGTRSHRSGGTYLPAIYETGVVANLEAALNAEFKKSTNAEEFAGKVAGVMANILGYDETFSLPTSDVTNE